MRNLNLHRRRLLQVGAIGFSGLNLPSVLRAGGQQTAKAKSCILLYMDGGPSHIDLLDLKPGAPPEIRGPYSEIATSVPGLRIGELLPLVAQQMHRAVLIRSVRHEEVVHDPAVYQMLTGYKHVSSAGGLKVEETDLPQMAASFGATVRTPAVMPKVIQLPQTMTMEGRVLPGQNAGVLGAARDPFCVDVTKGGEVGLPSFGRDPQVSLSRLDDRVSLLRQFNQELSRLESSDELERMDEFQSQALEILRSPRVEEAFHLTQEPAALRERYGRNRHGQSVLLARRLVEAGSRFVTVYWGREDQDWADGRGNRPANNPWDTHRNHFPLVERSLVPRADRALSALLQDLGDRGLLDDTLVIWMGDFGRTPRITREWASRDHWPHAFSVLMAGGSLKPGCIYGRTDKFAAYVEEDPVTPADLTATIFEVLGVNPHASVVDTQGRLHQLSTGTPLRELII